MSGGTQFRQSASIFADAFAEVANKQPDALSEYARVSGMAIAGPTGYYNGRTETYDCAAYVLPIYAFDLFVGSICHAPRHSE